MSTQVHWIRSVQRVEKLVCQTAQEKTVFRTISSRITEEPYQNNVLRLFDILAGERPLSDGENIIPDFKVPSGVKNDSWGKLKPWSRWWKRVNHLSEFNLSPLGS